MQDIASKLHALAEKGPRGVYVFSAAGAVSQATIFQPGPPDLFLRYKVWLRSFKPNSYKAQEKKHRREDTMASPPPPSAAPYKLTVVTPISPPKHDVFQPVLTPTPPALPLQTHVEPEKNMTTDKENMNGSEAKPDQVQSPDINVSFSGE